MIEISDTSLDLSQTQTYTLSIRLIPSGFCFAISDKEKRVIYYSCCEGAFPTESAILQKSFAQVLLCVDSNTYTLLPNLVFQSELQEQYWNLNFGFLSPTDQLQADNVRLTDIVNLYSYLGSEQRYLDLKKQYPALKLIHRQSIQMCVATMRNKQSNHQQLYIHVLENAFDVLLMEKGKILLANTYDYHKEDEFLYYILNLFEQLKLDRYAVEVIIGGAPEGKEKELLSKYLRNVQDDQQPLLKEMAESLEKDELDMRQYTLFNAPFAI